MEIEKVSYHAAKDGRTTERELVIAVVPGVELKLKVTGKCFSVVLCPLQPEIAAAVRYRDMIVLVKIGIFIGGSGEERFSLHPPTGIRSGRVTSVSIQPLVLVTSGKRRKRGHEL